MAHPVGELISEHRLIERVLEELDARLAGNEFPADYLAEALDFFSAFADGCHHRKEEDALFPALVQAGVPVDHGPIGCMLSEHEQGRRYLAAIAEDLGAARQGDADARARIRESAAGYSALLRGHIWKEDNVLFRMAEQFLASESDVRNLRDAFRRTPDLRARYETWIESMFVTAAR